MRRSQKWTYRKTSFIMAVTYGKKTWSLNSGNLRRSRTWSISACALVWTSGFKTMARMNTTIAAPVESAPAASSNEALDRPKVQKETIPAQIVEAVCIIISFHLSVSNFPFAASKPEDTKEWSTVPCDCHSSYLLSTTIGLQTHNTRHCHLERGIREISPYFLPFFCQTLEVSTRDPFRHIFQPW